MDELIHAEAEKWNFTEIRPDDWTVRRMLEAYPAISVARARAILDNQVEQGLLERLWAKNPNGGGATYVYRKVVK